MRLKPIEFEDIERKLEEARFRSDNFGKLYGAKETADDRLKLVYAKLYEDIPAHVSTVAEKDAWVKRQKEYREAVEYKAEAYASWKAAETFMKVLLTEVEVWRTQQANNRWMDKGHA